MSVKVTATIVVNGQKIVIEADDIKELERQMKTVSRLSKHLEAVDTAPTNNLLTEG